MRQHRASEPFQSHRRHVAQPGDRGRQPHPVASAGGFQVVQEDDHRPRHRHGAQDLRVHRQAAAKPNHDCAHALAGADTGRADDPALAGREIFICGGAQLYQQALPLCSDLYLTLVQCVVEGDTFFPPFEDQFELAEEVLDRPEFKILHYRRRGERVAGEGKGKTEQGPQGESPKRA
jgi:hypothetical protein